MYLITFIQLNRMMKVVITPKTFWHLYSCVVCVSWYTCGGQLEIHSSHQVGLGDWTPVVGVGGKCPCPLSHLAGPVTRLQESQFDCKMPLLYSRNVSFAVTPCWTLLDTIVTCGKHITLKALCWCTQHHELFIRKNCWSSRGSASRKDFSLVLKWSYQRVF